MYLKDDNAEYYIKSFENVNSVVFDFSNFNYEVRLYFNNSHDDIILFYENEDFARTTYKNIIQQLYR